MLRKPRRHWSLLRGACASRPNLACGLPRWRWIRLRSLASWRGRLLVLRDGSPQSADGLVEAATGPRERGARGKGGAAERHHHAREKRTRAHGTVMRVHRQNSKPRFLCSKSLTRRCRRRRSSRVKRRVDSSFRVCKRLVSKGAMRSSRGARRWNRSSKRNVA